MEMKGSTAPISKTGVRQPCIVAKTTPGPETHVSEVRLTEKQYWDERWDKVRLPEIVEPDTKHPISKEIIRVLQAHLPAGKLSAMEIGGAPGQFAAYLSKFHGYAASVLEYSEAGCRKTRENFDLLGLDVALYHRDFFSDLSDLPRFDIVLSMGFIEHFDDLGDILRRHVDLLTRNGILILGVPNLRGISQKVLTRTAPDMLSRHNLEAMDLENWRILEDEFGMTPLFKGYLAGYQPRTLKRCERRTPMNLLIRYTFKLQGKVLSFLPFLSRFNSPAWSAYLLGIYKRG